MKRILFIVINDLTYDQRMQRICTSLSGNGHDITLIGRKLKNSVSSDKMLPYRQVRMKCFFNKGKIFYIEYNIRLFLYILFQKYDIACAIDLDTILPVLLCSSIRGKKKVYDAHEFFTEVPELTGRPFTQKIWELVGKIAVSRMDECYTVNDSLAAIFKEKYGKNFSVIKNVPILKNQPVQKGESDKYIIYQGAINKGRGLESLIKAVTDIEIKVFIAGQGDIFDEIKNLIETENLADKVILKGPFIPEELFPLTSAAWIGYNVLDAESLNYFYSLSNKFFSYIHAGVPVITNNFPEYKKINEIFEVSVFADNDSNNIKNAILRLMKDQTFYDKLKENCLIAREIYNWQKEEAKLLEIYNAI